MTHIQHMAQKNDGGPGAVTRRWNGGTDDGEREVVVGEWNGDGSHGNLRNVEGSKQETKTGISRRGA